MKRERLPLPKGVPRTLRFESVAFDVAALADGRLAFAYYDGSRRVVIKRRSLDELRAEAARIAVAILNADTAAKDMTADDCRTFIAARNILQPLDISIDQGARILSESAKLAGGINRVVEACRWFGQSQREVQAATTLEVVEHFIRTLRRDGLDRDYVEPMEADLLKFSARFECPFTMISAKSIDEWLDTLNVGSRRRRNIRGELVTLFNFGVDHGYLPENIKTAAQRVKRPKVARKAPALYTPEELDLLLLQCHQPESKKHGRKDYLEFLPVLVIAAFAGLRWEEILGLEWKHIHWEDSVIEVGEENKTGYRLAPIQPNLMTWLAPHRGKSIGYVCKWRKRSQVGNIVRRLGRRAGLPVGARRYANAFRHSFITYRVAVTKNMPQVAYEAGNSVPEIKRSYNRASLEKVATKWFEIARDVASNVMQMPLISFRG